MRGRLLERTWEWNPHLDAPRRHRRACKYKAFVPHPLAGSSLSLEGTVAGSVSEAEQAILALNSDAQPALAPLARLLLRTESIASSKIEGLQVGVRQLARAAAKTKTGRKASSTALEVLGNIDAMQLAIEQAASAQEFREDHIVEIHRKLMAHAPNSHVAGQIRTDQNWIGGNDYNPCGADFVPPPPDFVADLLQDLCAAIADESLPPLVQAALVHAQFETVHPFADGNGRTGRALIHVVLRRRGLAAAYVPPISVRLATHKDGYIGGLRAFRKDHLDEWIEHFAHAAGQAAALATRYLAAVSELTAEWRRRLADGPAPRSDAAAWAVLDVLPAYPIISAPVAAAATGRSKAAIHLAVEQLAEAGVLEAVSASARNRSWEVVGLLDLLEALEVGQALPADWSPAQVHSRAPDDST